MTVSGTTGAADVPNMQCFIFIHYILTTRVRQCESLPKQTSVVGCWWKECTVCAQCSAQVVAESRVEWIE